MAKLDLISLEWTDLVFEGRNQDYGAYQLRKGTSRRNIWSIIIVALAAALLFLGLTVHRMAEPNRTVMNMQAVEVANIKKDKKDVKVEKKDPVKV
ncbi:MAG: energy transducer TonB, partial [Prevotella sp.]|nr:energy transducer TonB [Prevotella sp.]